MRKRIVLPVLALCAALAGCDDKATTSAEQQKLSEVRGDVGKFEPKTNSPDMAIKSWWQGKDIAMKQMLAVCDLVLANSAQLSEKMATIAGPDIRTEARCGKAEQFQRTIANVEVQSETRALVLARVKNVTPPDEGATTDSSDQKTKDTGSVFRYTLERLDGKSAWKISSIEEMPSYSQEWKTVQQKPRPGNYVYVNEYFQ